MRLLFFLCFVVTNTVISRAQVHWSQGVIVLKDEQVIVGEVQLHSDVLLLKNHEATIVYPAHQVSSFRYYDAQANINRHYLSLSDPRFVFPVLRYFEVVTCGEIAVVRRDNYPLLNGGKDETDYVYFSLKEQELVSLKKFKTRMYEELLDRYPLLLKEYIVSQRLNPNRMGDAIRIIRFYNQQVLAGASIAAL